MSANYTNLLYHLVFSTKGRIPLITDEIREPLYQYIGGIVRSEGGALLEIGGIEDHIHLLVRLKPTLALSDAVRLIKSNSSKWLNDGSYVRDFRWQTGYGAFTVSKSMMESVRRYIRNQPEHHRKQTFKAEFVDLLKLNNVDYNKKYLWD